MKPFTRKMWLTAIGAGTALTIVASASPAWAVTLNGDWAPFTRCPVDDSSMLAADGVNVSSGCLAADSPSGTIKLGNTTAATGDSNLQLGILSNNTTNVTTAVAPSGGAIAAAPVVIPGGLLGLMCPSSIPVVSQVCAEITNSTLNKVTASIEPAGSPSNLSLFAIGTQGQVIVTVPVKIQLSNPLLGSGCFIGTNSHPIVLNLTTQATPTGASFDLFDPNGTSDPNGTLALVTESDATVADTTFAVPGASGCGLLGVLDLGLDLKTGLPSPSGNNSLVLNNVTSWLGAFEDSTSVAPNEGQALSNAWHSAEQ